MSDHELSDLLPLDPTLPPLRGRRRGAVLFRPTFRLQPVVQRLRVNRGVVTVRTNDECFPVTAVVLMPVPRYA